MSTTHHSTYTTAPTTTSTVLPTVPVMEHKFHRTTDNVTHPTGKDRLPEQLIGDVKTAGTGHHEHIVPVREPVISAPISGGPVREPVISAPISGGPVIDRHHHSHPTEHSHVPLAPVAAVGAAPLAHDHSHHHEHSSHLPVHTQPMGSHTTQAPVSHTRDSPLLTQPHISQPPLGTGGYTQDLGNNSNLASQPVGSGYGSSSSFASQPVGSGYGSSSSFASQPVGSGYGSSSSFASQPVGSGYGSSSSFASQPVGSGYGSSSSLASQPVGSGYSSTEPRILPAAVPLQGHPQHAVFQEAAKEAQHIHREHEAHHREAEALLAKEEVDHKKNAARHEKEEVKHSKEQDKHIKQQEYHRQKIDEHAAKLQEHEVEADRHGQELEQNRFAKSQEQGLKEDARLAKEEHKELKEDEADVHGGHSSSGGVMGKIKDAAHKAKAALTGKHHDKTEA